MSGPKQRRVTGGRPKGGGFGAKVEAVYTVQDAAGNPIAVAGMVPLEQVTQTMVANGGAAPLTSQINPDKPKPLGPYQGTKNTGKTDSNGRFVDAPLGEYFNFGFSLNSSQKLYIQRPGDPKPIYVGTTHIEVGNNSIKLTYEAPKGVAGPKKQVITVKAR